MARESKHLKPSSMVVHEAKIYHDGDTNPRPRQPGNYIDVYLEPLIEDLELLWKEGVKVYDALLKKDFTLRCILFLTINDYPAFGNSPGQPVHGNKACVQCVENTTYLRLMRSKK